MSIAVVIDLGDGRSDSIRVTPNTDIRVLASRFCMKHNLPSESEQALIQELKRNWSALSPSPTKFDSQNNSILSTNFTNPIKTPDQSLIVKKEFANAGVKIYEKGKRYQEIIATKVEKFRKMREENENKNLTFSPKINQSKYKSSVESLLMSGLKSEEKLEKKRGEKLNKEINECTFSPCVSRSSSKYAEKQRRSMSPDRTLSFGSRSSEM